MSLFARSSNNDVPENEGLDLQQAFVKISSARTEEEILESVGLEAARLTGATGWAVFLYDRKYRDLHGRCLSGKDIRFGVGQGVAGLIAEEMSVWRSRKPVGDPQYQQSIDGLRQDQAPDSLMGAPIMDDHGELYGVVEVAGKEGGSFSEDDANALELLCGAAGPVVVSVRRTVEWRGLAYSLAGAVGRAVDTRLGVQVNHCVRVRNLAVGLGQVAELTSTELECLELAALLQDVGRLQTVPVPGKELEDRLHVFFAEAFMRSVDFPERLRPVRELACSQHEHFDGSGFPRGIPTSRLPRSARILALVTAYDSMLFAPGPGGKSLTEEQALQQLRCDSGHRFDPDLVRLFIDKQIYLLEKRLYDRLERETPVDVTPILSNGREGRPVECAALDISSGGMLFAFPGKLEMGSLVRLLIHLPGERLEAMGKVVRILPGDGPTRRIGISFLWQATK